MQMSKHLLLLLLISSVSNLEVGLGEKEAIELKSSSQFEYNKEKNYFKFLYNTPGDSYLLFYFYNDRPDIYVIDPHNQKKRQIVQMVIQLQNSNLLVHIFLKYNAIVFFAN